MKNAEESLSLIKSLVEDNRKVVLGSGMPSIIWGIFVTIALMLTYLGIHKPVRTGWFYLLVWLMATGLSLLISTFVESKRAKCTVSTYSRQILGIIWLAHWVMIMIFAFVTSTSGVVDIYAISPIIGTVLGSAYFINGYVNQYRWLKLIGVFWWIASVFLFYLVKVDVYGGSNILLYFAGLLVLLQVIPGIKLERRWRKENR